MKRKRKRKRKRNERKETKRKKRKRREEMNQRDYAIDSSSLWGESPKRLLERKKEEVWWFLFSVSFSFALLRSHLSLKSPGGPTRQSEELKPEGLRRIQLRRILARSLKAASDLFIFPFSHFCRSSDSASKMCTVSSAAPRR